MTTLHILWLNLATQLAAAIACLWTFGHMRGACACSVLGPIFLTEDHSPRWHSDPITEAITKLQIANDTIGDLRHEVEVLKAEAVRRDDLIGHYVTKEDFAPVRNGFYGMVTFIVLSFLASVAAVIAWKTASPK